MGSNRGFSKRGVARAALVAGLIGLSAPAAAQSQSPFFAPGASRWDLAPRDFSRQNWLYGETAISAAVAKQQELSTSAGGRPVRSFARTALYTAPTYTVPGQAVARFADDPAPQAPRSALSAPVRFADYRPAVAYSTETASVSPSGGPNVFGSVAVAVGSTPLDAKWQGVSGADAAGAAGWEGVNAAAGAKIGREQLDAVNRWVNDRLRFVNDGADAWAGAAEALARGAGDCEDFALTKMQILRAFGVPEEDLFLVVARDTVRRADHAVLVVRLGDEMLMLDNNSDQIADARQQLGYRPMFSYSATGSWIHGYPYRPAFNAGTQLAAAGAP